MRPQTSRACPAPTVESLEDRVVPAGQTLALTGGHAVLSRTIVGGFDEFTVTMPQDGRLTAGVHAGNGDTRLSLLTAGGQLLLQSDGVSRINRDDLFDQHLTGGAAYLLRVESLTGPGVSYTLEVGLTPSTAPFRPLPVGSSPWGLITADLDGDEVLDLVSANFQSDDVSVMRGLGDGTFAAEARYAAGSGATAVTAADVNGDGHLDLITADFTADTVSVLMNSGDGTFAPAVAYATGSNPIHVVAANFNDDEFLDLAVADFASDTVSVLLNAGDGTFRGAVAFDVGMSPAALASGDFNGDSRIDLAVANYNSNDVSVLRGDGQGSFTNAGTFAVGESPYAILALDVNRDGRLDLVTANFTTDDISVLAGRGGTFAGEQRLAGGTGATGLAAADFDADGRTDIAAANYEAGTLSVYRGIPGGTLDTQLQFPAGHLLSGVAAGDFDHDGRADLAVINEDTGTITVLPGRGDGTFLVQASLLPGPAPYGSVPADLDGDGRLDIVAVNYGTGDVTVLKGGGDGRFRAVGRFLTGSDSDDVAVGDLNGDGVPDVVVSNYSTSDVSVLLGTGGGRLSDPVAFAVGDIPQELLILDVNGDGRLDVVTVNRGSEDVSVLLGHGDGTFADALTLDVGGESVYLASGYFNADGRVDLVVTNRATDTVTVFLGNGDGTFGNGVLYDVGDQPLGVIVHDLNGDGVPDLATANKGSEDVSVLFGLGDGTFEEGVTFGTGTCPWALWADDFDHDGVADLAVLSRDRGTVAVFLGNGDRTFRAAGQYQVGKLPLSLTAADYDGDGNIDLSATNYASGDVTVLFGRGDGTFSGAARTPTGSGPADVAVGDFDADGRTDTVTVNPGQGVVSIRLGLGNGAFQEPGEIVVGGTPVGVETGDFNGDGRLDLVLIDRGRDVVELLLGLGDGTFRPPEVLAAVSRPVELVVGDFNRDHRPDVAVARESGEVIILAVGAGGQATLVQQFQGGNAPTELLAGDFNRDGRLDLAITSAGLMGVGVAFGRPDGTFGAPRILNIGHLPSALAAGDIDGDGFLDLVAGSYSTGKLYVGRGDGTGWFQPWFELDAQCRPTGLMLLDFDGDGVSTGLAAFDFHGGALVGFAILPEANFQAIHFEQSPFLVKLAEGDFSGDGILDAIGVAQTSDAPLVQLGLGNGYFQPPGATIPLPSATPLFADLDGDGTSDVVVLRRDGAILFRRGMPSAPGSYHPPVVVNADATLDAEHSHWGARDLALVRAGGQTLVAAIDGPNNALMFFSYEASADGGSFVCTSHEDISGFLATRLRAGDLNGDGLDDLALISSGDDQLRLLFQTAAGEFEAADLSLPTGTNPTDLIIADVDGLHGPDLVVTDDDAADVRVFLNDGTGTFSTALRYRAATGLSGLTETEGQVTTRSQAGAVAVIAGQFDGGSAPDLVVLNPNLNRFTLLTNTDRGGLLNPVSPLNFGTGDGPLAVTAGFFDAGTHLDLAVLNEVDGTLSVFLGDGRGGFAESQRVAAGNLPTGLTARDIDGDGRLDLTVGSQYGDVLTLMGNGDGTFQPYRRADRGVALAVADLNGDGRNDFVFGNQGLDRVTVEYSRRGSTFRQDRSDGLLAPGAVTTADLNRDGVRDLVVANGAGNTVVVYLGEGSGQFAPARSFFVGTNPTHFSVADLNGDRLPDLVVANTASNDVSVLFGQSRGTAWTLTPGPRLGAGVAPVSTAVADVDRNGVPDIVVGNSLSRTVAVLPGVGGGFFDDRAPRLIPMGQAPGEVFVGRFDARPGLDLVVLTPSDGSLTLFSGFDPARAVTSGAVGSAAGLPGDFNRDGLDDLVVADAAGGHVSLLLGGAEGLQTFAVLSSPGLDHPTGLAFDSLAGGVLNVYAVGDGSESVVGLEFLIDLGPPGVLVGLPRPTAPGEPPPAVASYESVPGSSLGLVATLLAGDAPPEFLGPVVNDAGSGGRGAAADPAVVLIAADAGAGAGLSGGGEEEAAEEEQDIASEEVEGGKDQARNSFIIGADDPRVAAPAAAEAAAAAAVWEWVAENAGALLTPDWSEVIESMLRGVTPAAPTPSEEQVTPAPDTPSTPEAELTPAPVLPEDAALEKPDLPPSEHSETNRWLAVSALVAVGAQGYVGWERSRAARGRRGPGRQVRGGTEAEQEPCSEELRP